MSKIVAKTYDHHGVQVNVLFTETAYFNATVAAKAFGKECFEWLRSKDCKEYVAGLIENSNRENSGLEKLTEDQLIKTVRGGAYKGTWLHRKLAVPFARWLNVQFAIWCDEIIYELLMQARQGEDIRQHQLKSHLRRDVQIQNSKDINALMFERGGQEKVIAYNRMNCKVRMDKEPKEVVKIGRSMGLKAKECGSAKEVLRRIAPEKACGMSFADDLIFHGGDEFKSLSLSVKAEEIFAGMMALGVTPTELMA